MSNWGNYYRNRLISFVEAAQMVQSNDVVATGLAVGACSPEMVHAILDRHEELENVRLVDTVQLRASRLYDPEYMKRLEGRITYAPYFGIATTRGISQAQIADFHPNAAQDLADKIATTADVFIVMVTPPNEQGYVNLGLSNFYSLEAIKNGRENLRQRITIAEVNEEMPTVYGDNWMHVFEFDYFIEHSSPIPVFARASPSQTEQAIAQNVLELIKDNDTIQMGIGGIPEAVISGLDDRKNLGVLSEMFPIGLPQLVDKGVVTNAKKPFHRGVTVATFCMGDAGMYKYVKENPACEFYPASYTNNPAFIAQHPNMVAINMALMVDLTGQIASEGVGHRMISGSGGQLDFMLGAYWSKGGRAISVLQAARKKADGTFISSLVPELPPGTPVTVPRTYAHYVVSEFGIANLRYKSRRDRALELISIAHPDLRGELKASLRRMFFPNPG